MKRIVLITGLLGTSLACGTAMAAPAYIEKAVADAARPADDTKRDAQRHPAELLQFAGIKPGMTVVDMLPGTGYFTRIFAKAVGPKGQVYAYVGNQGDAAMKAKGQDPDNQLASLKAAYANVGVIHGPLDQFVTPTKVDVVWTSDNLHDMHNKMFGGLDIAATNKAIFAALKPGGIYMVIDHRAAKGAGAASTEALHRMDEDIAKQEVEAAGFKLVSESKILTRPEDDNTKKIFEQGEHDHTDQFVLKFRKPG
jgi:predicted methyltransferase